MATDITKMSVAELQKKIADLNKIGESEAAAKYQAELTGRQGKGSSSSSGGVTQEDWDKSDSKFPKEGLYPAEFFAAEWKNVNVSVLLKFVITGEDYNGSEGELWPGIGATSIWRFKEICKALGVDPVFKNGALDVAAMFPKFAGKTGMVQYGLKKTNKGTMLSVPLTVVPAGTEMQEEAPF